MIFASLGRITHIRLLVLWVVMTALTASTLVAAERFTETTLEKVEVSRGAKMDDLDLSAGYSVTGAPWDTNLTRPLLESLPISDTMTCPDLHHEARAAGAIDVGSSVVWVMISANVDLDLAVAGIAAKVLSRKGEVGGELTLTCVPKPDPFRKNGPESGGYSNNPTGLPALMLGQDHSSLVRMPMVDDHGALHFPDDFTLDAGDSFYIRLQVNSLHCYCEWELHFDFVVNSKPVHKIVRRAKGIPFLIAAGAGRMGAFRSVIWCEGHGRTFYSLFPDSCG